MICRDSVCQEVSSDWSPLSTGLCKVEGPRDKVLNLGVNAKRGLCNPRGCSRHRETSLVSDSFYRQWTFVDWIQCSTQTHLVVLAIRQGTSEHPPWPQKSFCGRQAVAAMSLSWVCLPA